MVTGDQTTAKGTILRNVEREIGWFPVADILFDKLARIIGSKALQIYLTFKSLCKNGCERPFPKVRQRDWAEYMGMGLQAYQQNLKILEDVGLISIQQPTGKARWEHAPMTITIFAADEISITAGLLERYKVKKFTSDCVFQDSLFDPESWRQTMFRSREERKCSEPGDIENHMSGDIENHMSGDIENHMSYCYKEHSRVKGHSGRLSKESLKGPDGPSQFSNDDSFNKKTIHTDEWVNISVPSHTKTTPPRSSMTHRIREKTASKSKDASRRTTTRPIPPREEMPKTFQTWYSITGVSKSKPDTYWKNVDLLHKLERGEFPIKYKSLKPAFVERLKLTRQHLCKRWTDEELAELLETRFRPMVEDAGYWPEDKSGFKGMSFEQFIRNPRTGYSWFLEVAYQDFPRPTRFLRDQQTLKDSPYQNAVHHLNEEFFNIPTNQVDELAELTRQFAAIMEVMRVVPCREAGGLFNSTPKDNPMPTARSIAQFLVETYGGMDNPSPGMLAPSSKSIFRWTEQYDWTFPVAGHQKTLRDLFKEYCSSPTKWRQRYAEVAPVMPEDWEETETKIQDLATRMESVQVQINQTDSEVHPPKPTAAETKQKEETVLEQIAPDDIIYSSEEERSAARDRGWKKTLKSTLARLRQAQPARTLKEVCESMARTQREKADTATWNSYEGF